MRQNSRKELAAARRQHWRTLLALVLGLWSGFSGVKVTFVWVPALFRSGFWASKEILERVPFHHHLEILALKEAKMWHLEGDVKGHFPQIFRVLALFI